jgi:hypothetical protein
MSLLAAIMAASGSGGSHPYHAPPTSFHQGLATMNHQDGTDLFRLMSKANRYAGAKNHRKQRKGDRYAYMAGQMLHQSGINHQQFAGYHQAYAMGPQHGCQPAMLHQFRSGQAKQQRQQRRAGKGRYNGRPQNHARGLPQGARHEEGSMFEFNDSDTSDSSDDDEE